MFNKWTAIAMTADFSPPLMPWLDSLSMPEMIASYLTELQKLVQFDDYQSIKLEVTFGVL